MAAPVVCTRCLTTAPPKTYTPGSIIIELFAWLLLLLPGLVYSLWRISARYTGCSACGARETVPLGSPAAQRLVGGGQ